MLNNLINFDFYSTMEGCSSECRERRYRSREEVSSESDRQLKRVPTSHDKAIRSSMNASHYAAIKLLQLNTSESLERKKKVSKLNKSTVRFFNDKPTTI